MNSFKSICFFIFGALLGTSCFWFVAYHEQINDKYYLGATDTLDQMSVWYDLGDGGIGRIGETVFSVGWDERYIIAKQHPLNQRAITNYYILDMAKDDAFADPEESVIGPLDEEDFQLKLQEMGLSLDFTVTINALE